ncbi:MAG TPA: hypothetical protein ENH31_00770 [Nitrospirae bacterium]|nr:soxR reducing system protein RseC [bacterium BMS3Abin10]HDK41237.1 hypothetical protein [Nitrospirota bacterium]HDK81086.1 hypothetical protein [Nitrospirota bacterium]
MEETGVITQTEGDIAKVVVQKKSMCEGCSASSACKPSDKGMEIEALNPIQARVGQTVRVSLRPQAYMKGALFIYGLPLVAFIAGVIIGKNLGETYLTRINSDIVSFLGGIIAFILSFLVVKSWSRKAEKNLEQKPVIEEILDTESLSQ